MPDTARLCARVSEVAIARSAGKIDFLMLLLAWKTEVAAGMEGEGDSEGKDMT